MGREVRRVHKDWRHPKNSNGNYISLSYGFTTDLEDWEESFKKWMEGYIDGINGIWRKRGEAEKNFTFEGWNGKKPEKENYMSEWPEKDCTHLMMYENTSEGTPISPAFDNPEDLAKWLADNKASAFGGDTATYEQWLNTCKNGGAPSAVLDCHGMRSGVEAMGDYKKND